MTPIPRDGPVSSLTGYPGVSYQAVRYEPLCGTLGTDSRFDSPFQIGNYCGPAGDAFGNDTSATLAFYDTTGTQLTGVIVGNGVPLCMCSAFGRSDGWKGNICLYIDGTGQGDVWWNTQLEHILASDYRISGKAMLSCVGANLSSLQAQWSSTAPSPSKTVSTKNIAGITTVLTSVFTILSTGTNSDGAPTTFFSLTTQTTIPTDSSGNNGYNESDKIALGVGIGIGVPTFLVGLIALCVVRWNGRRGHREEFSIGR